MNLLRLHELINATVPITGVSIPNIYDKTTWKCSYVQPPSAQQSQQVANIITNFKVPEDFNDDQGYDAKAAIAALQAQVTSLSSQVSGKLTATFATAAQQKAGTSTTTVISPEVQVQNKSAAKVWISFSANGTIDSGYGATSVTKLATGNWRITFAAPFANTNYVPLFSTELNVLGLLSSGVKVGTKTTTTIDVSIATLLGILADPTGKLYFVAYGDQ